MESIENYDYDAGRHPIATNQVASLYGIVRDSFMTFMMGVYTLAALQNIQTVQLQDMQ